MRTGDRERRLVVTSHRLLLDEWSHAALVRAVLAAFCTGSGTAVADRGAARQCTLDGQSREPARTSIYGPDLRSETYAECDFDLAAASGAQDPIRLSSVLPTDLVRRIHVRAAERRFDPEAVVHGAWAFALSRLTGRPEVVFAAPVPDAETGSSDEPGPIDAARTYLPVTARVGVARSAADLMRGVSQVGVHDSVHEVPPGASLDTVAALEPEPIGPVTPRLGIRIDTLSTFDAKPFPLSFSIVPGASWLARLDYQPAALPGRVAESVLADAVAFLEATAYAPDRLLDRIGGRTTEVRSARVA